MEKSTIIGACAKTQEKVALSAQGRGLSTYIIGKPGMGKSGLLETIVYQDLYHGAGLCFLDPHEDSAERVLSWVPKHRMSEVICWDPFDLGRPFGLNPFQCNDTNWIDSTASNFIAALASLAEFAPVFAGGASRMMDVLTNLALAFVVNQGFTLAETPRFLTDEDYRRRFYPALSSEFAPVREFWEQFDRKRDSQQDELTASTLNKLRRFQTNRRMRGIFGQATNSIDFREVMDHGQIVIVKLSGARLGADNAAMIGAFLVWNIYQAALSRVDTPESQRHPFHLIADEFQTFMSTAFASLIEQTRKYRVDVTVAHQTRAQLHNDLKAATLAVGNKIVFGVTGHDAKELAEEFRKLVPEPTVAGERPKRQITPHPLEHLRQNGHVNTQVIDRYHALVHIIDDWFDDATLAAATQRRSYFTPHLYNYSITTEIVAICRSKLLSAIDEALFRVMVVGEGTDIGGIVVESLRMGHDEAARELYRNCCLSPLRKARDYYRDLVRQHGEEGKFLDSGCEVKQVTDFQPTYINIRRNPALFGELFGMPLPPRQHFSRPLIYVMRDGQRVMEEAPPPPPDPDDTIIGQRRYFSEQFRYNEKTIVKELGLEYQVKQQYGGFCPSIEYLTEVDKEKLTAEIERRRQEWADDQINEMREKYRRWKEEEATWEYVPHDEYQFDFDAADHWQSLITNTEIIMKWEEQLVQAVCTLAAPLACTPCYVSTGQYESIYDKPRLYADVEAEIANALTTLPKYTARCILAEEPQAQEYTIRTYPPPAVTTEGIQRAHAIQEHSRQQYGRDRQDVEREIERRARGKLPPDDLASARPLPRSPTPPKPDGTMKHDPAPDLPFTADDELAEEK